MNNFVLKLPRKETESAISEDFRVAELYENRVFFHLKNLKVNLQVRDYWAIGHGRPRGSGPYHLFSVT